MRARRYVGHNPAGGAMVIALLLAISGIVTTGFMMTTDAYWGVEWVEDAHEVLGERHAGFGRPPRAASCSQVSSTRKTWSAQ